MYLLMEENKAVYEFEIDRESNKVVNCNKLKEECTLPIENIDEFLSNRITNPGFLRKHENTLAIIEELNSKMCKKELTAIITNYTCYDDKIWVKKSEDTANYRKATRRLNHCTIGLMPSAERSLLVYCSKNCYSFDYGHLFCLEDIILIFTSENERKCFLDEEEFKVVNECNKLYMKIPNISNTKPVKFTLEKNICTFHVDEERQSIVIDEVYNSVEYLKFKYYFGSIANFYATHKKGKVIGIEKNLMTSPFLEYKITH